MPGMREAVLPKDGGSEMLQLEVQQRLDQAGEEGGGEAAFDP